MDKPRLLVISAHSADFCSRSGGTIANYTRDGATVHVVLLTLGERGESEDYWNSGSQELSIVDVKNIRMQEVARAAEVLGTSIEVLDWDDYPLRIDMERLLTLTRILRRQRPNIILTHWKSDVFNQDHQITADAVIRACTLAAAPGFDGEPDRVFPSTHTMPHVFFFEPTLPRSDVTGFVPDTFVDVDKVFKTKMEALGSFHSQSKLCAWYTRWAEYRAMQARQWNGCKIEHAEAFKRFTAAIGQRLPVSD